VGAGREVCKEGKWEQDGKYVRKGSGSRMGSMQGKEVGAGLEVCKKGWKCRKERKRENQEKRGKRSERKDKEGEKGIERYRGEGSDGRG